MLAFSTDAEALFLPTPTEGAGHEQDSRGHGDWIEVTRLASDCSMLLHKIGNYILDNLTLSAYAAVCQVLRPCAAA